MQRQVSTTVLARKWRPRNYEQLIGQTHVVQALTNALTTQRLHHAYLFTGTRGVGKTTIARIFAKSLNCLEGMSATPCGQCQACRDIDAGRFVDLIELDAASNTQVDSMRELLESALYAPNNARFKVYIIDEVHMLSRSAFNAMLKTLEEPPPHVKFILATTDPQKIPVTVLSRCLQFNLKQLPPAQIARHLQFVLGEEGISGDAGALQLVARAAQGSMRDALSLLDQAIAFSDGRVDEQQVRQMLGVIDQSYLFEILTCLQQQNGAGLLAVVDNMSARSLAFSTALQELASLLHRVALAQVAPHAIADDEPQKPALLQLAQTLSAELVQLCYQIAVHAREDLSLAPDEQSGFSMALLRMLAFVPGGERPALGVPVAPSPSVVAPSRVSTPTTPSVGATTPTVDTSAIQPAGADTLPEWSVLLAQVGIQGMALQVAKHAVLESFVDGVMTLCLAPESVHLQQNKLAIERLQARLAEYLGQPIRLQIVCGKPQVATPARIEQQTRLTRQQHAESAIASDPFVQAAQQQLAAQIVADSIQPINTGE